MSNKIALPEGGEPERASPMIAQFQALKAAHPDTLLFYRMGDFYELFFADAEQAAPALDIALTKRGRHGGEDIPMCGVPAHSAELYLHRLIRKGFRVAICEQLEDPAEARRRGGKTLVRRDVVRIVTPGTLTEDGLLEARQSNYLVAVAASGGGAGAGPGRHLDRRVRDRARGARGAAGGPGAARRRRDPGAATAAGRARRRYGARPPVRSRRWPTRASTASPPSGGCARRSRSRRWRASARSAGRNSPPPVRSSAISS